ncbi:MAG: DUF5518 domain-containing protein [Methanobacteriaceae archaeon]|nr:DUF5518 domain-containing protein [Methanobacteriaceae archaeon]
MDWKLIGISGLINAALTVVLSLIFLPLFFLGPLTGGFLASYLSKGYEDYKKMDKVDGAVVGAFSGIIGGLIIGLLSLLGFGAISANVGLISSQIGEIVGSTYINIYIIFQLSVGISFVLGIVGGVIGVIVKK